MNLSKRLSLICSLVQTGSKVCDVGTDHGYLPAFLYKSGKCISVCATDIKEKPLKNAAENLEKFGAYGVKLFLCDGLDAVSRDMADTVIIAGMGGEVISGIIERAPFLRDDTVTLILQPTTSADKLRQFLAENGYAVEAEVAVGENVKIYSVMKARFCATPYNIDGLRRAIGLLKPDCEDAEKYIKKQLSVAKKRAEELNGTGKNSELFNSDCLLIRELETILGGDK